MKLIVAFTFVWLICAQISCGQRSSSQQAPAAVPEGWYKVKPALCRSTGSAPDYPEARFKAVLYDFSPLVDHRVVIATGSATHVLSTAECSIKIERKLIENRWSRLIISNQRTHSFSAENCTIPLAFEGGELPYGSYSSLFTDSDDRSADLHLDVVTTNQSDYYLYAPPEQEPSNIWLAYGCNALDQIMFTWEKLEDTESL